MPLPRPAGLGRAAWIQTAANWSSHKAKVHPLADAYLDETFYHSLRFKHEFHKNAETKFSYHAPMATDPTFYFPVSFGLLAANLEPPV
jgi:hypothetical protein